MIKARTITENGTVQTLCRMCNSRCGIRVHIQQGRITQISPAEKVPMNQGRICPRGHAIPEVFYHPERLNRPLKRETDGSFTPVETEQALDEIAEELLKIKKRFGGYAVGAWKGEGVGFQQQEAYVKRFLHAFGSPNYFSNDSACFKGRNIGYQLVTGFGFYFPDFSKAKLILLLGTNTPVCHPPFMRELADARAQGAKLVVIDPRLNPIACLADIFAQPIPGTDGALAWGLINQIIRQEAYDKELVRDHVIGFDEVAAYAGDFTPEWVEAESGIYAGVVKEIAEYIIENRPHISCNLGAGLEHNQNGVNAVRAMVILSCLCGALDNRCGLVWPEMPDLACLTLDLPPSEGAPSEGDHRPIGSSRFPVLYELGGECHTMSAMDCMLDQGEYPLRGLIVTAANPAVTNPNTDKVCRALRSLDLLVVHDLFLTATAGLARYVLPATTFLERSEIHTVPNLQRIFLTQNVARVDGVIDEYTLWRELALRLGFDQDVFPWPGENDVNRFLLEPTGITLDELADHPEGIDYAPRTFRKYKSRPLPTVSGKLEFCSAYLKGLGFSELPEYTPPHHLRESPRDYPLCLTTGGRKTLLYHTRHLNIPGFREIHRDAEIEIHPDDADGLGMENGDRVRVVSQVGALELTARVVHRSELLRGVVEVYHGWEERPINRVTFDEVNDPISGFPLLKGVPVRLEKVETW